MLSAQPQSLSPPVDTQRAKMIVVFDIDGVLFNFGDSVKRYLDIIGQGHLWKSGPTPTVFWDFYKDWGWTGQEFVQMCNDGVDAGVIFRGPTRPGAVEAVNRVHDAGHIVIFVTDRQFGSTPAASHRATELWLDEHGFRYDGLIFSADKTIIPSHMSVEDKLENYDALDAAGSMVYLVNRQWNEVQGGDNRRRINNVTEFADIVLGHERVVSK